MNDFFKLAEKIARDWGAKNPIKYPDASQFYTPPFITCAWCNFMTFLDVISFNAVSVVNKRYAKVLDEIKLLEAGAHIPKESLLPCKKCGRSDAFFIGPLNFADIIANRRKAEEEKKRKMDNAVRVLQRAYKAYLRRVYGSAYSLAYVAHKRLLNKAADRMTALVRGRFARRQAKTERCLRIIQFAHPLLLKHALRPSPRRSQCFWYSRQADVDYFFKDYVDFIEKTGNLPPRMFVELNVREISVRIVARQAELLTLIQRAWRGVMNRRMVKILKSEITRIYQANIFRIMKIQRAYRGHYARLQVVKLVADRKRENCMNDYLKESGKKNNFNYRRSLHMKSITYYKKERAEEMTARSTNRLMPMDEYENKKLAAFADSNYFDVRATISNNMVMSQEEQEMFERKEEIAAELGRREFILARRDEHGPHGYGLRGFKPEIDLRSSAQNGFVSAKDAIIESRRSRSFRLYFEKELKAILDNMIERAQHSFKRGGNKPLYKDYNAEKPIHILLRPLETKLEEKEQGKGVVVKASSTASKKKRSDSSNLSASPENIIKSNKPGSASTSTTTMVEVNPNSGFIGSTNEIESHVDEKDRNDNKSPLAGTVLKGPKLSFSSGKEKLAFRNNRLTHKYCAFKYPKDVNVDPLAWLSEDLDILVKFKAQKQEAERAALKTQQDQDIMNRGAKK